MGPSPGENYVAERPHEIKGERSKLKIGISSCFKVRGGGPLERVLPGGSSEDNGDCSVVVKLVFIGCPIHSKVQIKLSLFLYT